MPEYAAPLTIIKAKYPTAKEQDALVAEVTARIRALEDRYAHSFSDGQIRNVIKTGFSQNPSNPEFILQYYPMLCTCS